MISDAVENCLTYIHNFDPNKSRNPFAYFTQIIYYAFLRKIQKEKKQLYIRYKALENSDIFGDLIFSESHSEDSTNISAIGIPKLYDNMKEFITSFEESINNKKKQKKKKTKKLAANNLMRHIGE